MSSNERRIAVGSAGSSTGFGALRALTAWDQPPKLLACDTNEKHLVAAASEFDFLRVAPAGSDGFATRMAEILASRGVTAFYPIHDAEIAAAAEQADVFGASEITLLAPASSAITITRDKLHMCELFSANGIPVPSSQRLDQAEWQGEVIHYKPRCGVGSHGTGILRSADALAARKTEGDAEEMIAQNFVEGQEVTIDVFCPEAGNVLASCCRERVEVKAGVSTKARIFESAVLKALAADVSRVLGLVGSFCYQVRGNPRTGEWFVIDVNPRVGGGTAMSVAAGMNFPLAHAAHFMGHDSARFFNSLKGGDVFVTRSYREHVARA